MAFMPIFSSQAVAWGANGRNDNSRVAAERYNMMVAEGTIIRLDKRKYVGILPK